MAAPALRADLEVLLADHSAAAAKDPFTNPYLLFALDLTRRMEAEAVDLDGVEGVIRAAKPSAPISTTPMRSGTRRGCSPCSRAWRNKGSTPMPQPSPARRRGG